ncbi:hypothetical protein Acr_09g0002760 [Actinidia rufa]|uniref:Uncharacterized protein n=1 Tax=Actinidia rufa TaxID=165716 RepID=A0A7J0F565_9ERIC|nr:hypothetical protein Acr_09g0002760 [Actinidia rufa]
MRKTKTKSTTPHVDEAFAEKIVQKRNDPMLDDVMIQCKLAFGGEFYPGVCYIGIRAARSLEEAGPGLSEVGCLPPVLIGLSEGSPAAVVVGSEEGGFVMIQCKLAFGGEFYPGVCYIGIRAARSLEEAVPGLSEVGCLLPVLTGLSEGSPAAVVVGSEEGGFVMIQCKVWDLSHIGRMGFWWGINKLLGTLPSIVSFWG